MGAFFRYQLLTFTNDQVVHILPQVGVPCVRVCVCHTKLLDSNVSGNNTNLYHAILQDWPYYVSASTI